MINQFQREISLHKKNSLSYSYVLTFFFSLIGSNSPLSRSLTNTSIKPLSVEDILSSKGKPRPSSATALPPTISLLKAELANVPSAPTVNVIYHSSGSGGRNAHQQETSGFDDFDVDRDDERDDVVVEALEVTQLREALEVADLALASSGTPPPVALGSSQMIAVAGGADVEGPTSKQNYILLVNYMNSNRNQSIV